MKIKRVGFGGIPIQRITQEDTNKVIDELVKQNMNFIDTARGYTISEEYIGNWKSLFDNDNPIYIEIGMGKGKFIIENALKYPDINFIGIEKYDSVVAKSLPKIPEGLSNLCVIRMDALNIDKVFSHEIDRIYLNFSDPWPKVRHASRRLSSKVFLDKYDNVFVSDDIDENRKAFVTYIKAKSKNIGHSTKMSKSK